MSHIISAIFAFDVKLRKYAANNNNATNLNNLWSVEFVSLSWLSSSVLLSTIMIFLI